jgi:hypothetical protein
MRHLITRRTQAPLKDRSPLYPSLSNPTETSTPYTPKTLLKDTTPPVQKSRRYHLSIQIQSKPSSLKHRNYPTNFRSLPPPRLSGYPNSKSPIPSPNQSRKRTLHLPARNETRRSTSPTSLKRRSPTLVKRKYRRHYPLPLHLVTNKPPPAENTPLLVEHKPRAYAIEATPVHLNTTLSTHNKEGPLAPSEAHLHHLIPHFQEQLLLKSYLPCPRSPPRL